MSGVNEGGGGIVDANARSEETESLESPVFGGVSGSINTRMKCGKAYSRNCSCETPSWLASVRGLPENKAENFLSKLIRS